MAQQKIELRKIRDFSENLNDTLLFIRQNFKPLLLSFLGIAGVFMLLAAITSGLYQGEMGGFFEQLIKGNAGVNDNPLQLFSGQYFLVLFLSWLNIVAMQVTIVSYIKVYETNNGQTPSIDQVWQVFRTYIVPVFFYTLITSILMALGLVLCIAPGVFLLVAFTPLPAIVILEEQSFGAAFNRCFILLKNNFWISLGLYLLVYVIYSFSSGIISTVIGGIAGVIYYFTTKSINNTVAVVTSILSIFSFVFYIIYYVSVVLHYYNLAERFDGTGMMRKLDTIGDTPQNFDNIQEQY